jgi:hypothetical protein
VLIGSEKIDLSHIDLNRTLIIDINGHRISEDNKIYFPEGDYEYGYKTHYYSYLNLLINNKENDANVKEISENVNENIKIYPNPSNSDVRIFLDFDVSAISGTLGIYKLEREGEYSLITEKTMRTGENTYTISRREFHEAGRYFVAGTMFMNNHPVQISAKLFEITN